jgi:hypothetical protein
MNEDVLLKYGLPGIFILILLAAIKWGAALMQKIIADHKLEREELERIHRTEREEWKKTIESQFENSNKITTNATSALTELTTLIKSKK